MSYSILYYLSIHTGNMSLGFLASFSVQFSTDRQTFTVKNIYRPSHETKYFAVYVEEVLGAKGTIK